MCPVLPGVMPGAPPYSGEMAADVTSSQQRRDATAWPPDEPDVILDAARQTVLDFGVRRTTVAEVARRAGLSRMTVYRRYPDGASLIRALMTREFGSLLARVGGEVDALENGRRRVVVGAVRTAGLLMAHPLLLRILELEPELLLPYAISRTGQFQDLARQVIAIGIADGQADGSVRTGDPEVLAAAIETAARGPVYAALALTAAERDVALAELERMLDGYLRPGG